MSRSNLVVTCDGYEGDKLAVTDCRTNGYVDLQIETYDSDEALFVQLARRSVAQLAEHLLYMLTTWPESPDATG